MRDVVFLAWRYLVHHRVRSAVLLVCIASAFLLPFAVTTLVDDFAESLVARARSTPLVVGAPGSRYDLVISSLHFTGRVPRALSLAELEAFAEEGSARVAPLHLGQSASGFPLVGTSPEYFELRGLAPAAGELPLVLGEAVVGSEVARSLDLEPGGSLLTDDGSLYDLSLRAPLKLSVTGVLAPTGTSDDRAVFCDLKTAWVALGIGHGHVAAEEQDDGRPVVFDAATYEYTEITAENLDSFHFHGEPEEFPVTALLLFPADARASTMLRARHGRSEELQVLRPLEVVEEMLDLVFRLKRFFDANAALVTLSTALFLALVVVLSVRVRARELATLLKLGCSRARVAAVLGTELGMLVALGLVAALLASRLLAGALRAALGA